MFNLQTIGENFISNHRARSFFTTLPNRSNILSSTQTKNVNSSFVSFIILKCAKCSEYLKYDVDVDNNENEFVQCFAIICDVVKGYVRIGVVVVCGKD